MRKEASEKAPDQDRQPDNVATGWSGLLLSSKLRPSQDRPKLVARSRLSESLDRVPGRRLTLLSAPAGFGKTTLLGGWSKGRAARGGSLGWLSLDEDDNDPARFLSYLVGAIKRSTGEEKFGEGVLAVPFGPTGNREGPESLEQTSDETAATSDELGAPGPSDSSETFRRKDTQP